MKLNSDDQIIEGAPIRGNSQDDKDLQHTAQHDTGNSVEDEDNAVSFDLPIDPIPTAVTDEASEDENAEAPRSGWRLFSSEDLPQVSLREILGGDYLIGSFLRRQIWFILFLVLLSIVYISNRYASQQEIIEEETMRKELIEKKNYALTQYAELTMRTRQSSIERLLKSFGDSTLTSAKEPPFIIYK